MHVTRLLAFAVIVTASPVYAQSHGDTPATATPTAAAHGAEPAARTPAKKGPTVSRVRPVGGPATAPAGGAHAAPAAHAPVTDHATPTAPAKKTGGYVATGAQPNGGGGGAHAASGKPKPVVSGLSAPRAPSADDHGAAAPAAPRAALPKVEAHAAGPHAADAHAAAPSHAEPGGAPPVAAAPATRAAAQKPARLATVHERLTAALAGIRTDSARDSGSAAQAGSHGAAVVTPRTPRVALTWPGPRWQVAWPSPGRVALRWPAPAPAPEAGAAPAVPPPHD